MGAEGSVCSLLGCQNRHSGGTQKGARGQSLSQWLALGSPKWMVFALGLLWKEIWQFYFLQKIKKSYKFYNFFTHPGHLSGVNQKKENIVDPWTTRGLAVPALHAVENPHMVSSRSSVYAVPLYSQVQPTSSHVVLQYMLLKISVHSPNPSYSGVHHTEKTALWERSCVLWHEHNF